MLKRLYQSSIGIMLIAVLSILINNLALAQDAPKDQLFLVHEETAKIDMISQYVETSKDWSKLMHEGGLHINFYAFERNDMHFYYVTPLTNYAQVDSFSGKFQTAIDKIGKEKFSALIAKNNASIKSTIDFIIKWSAELSYMPKKPRTELKDAGFVHWSFIHYKMDKRKEVMDILKEWKALYEKNNFPDAYDIYTMELGQDNNQIVVYDWAKNAVDYYKNDSDKSKEMKAEEHKLVQKITPYLTKMKEFNGWPRHDLDYIAK